jgi:small basic protein (TIGR04137 family)
MSIHRSFKSANRLQKHRNVLTRAERIEKLESMHKWGEDADSIFNLPKVRNIKVKGKKKKKKEEEAEEAQEI